MVISYFRERNGRTPLICSRHLPPSITASSSTDIRSIDHGNDPTYSGTDHTREMVPFLAYSPSMDGGGALARQESFAVNGATVAENFGVEMPEGTIGVSVLGELG